MKRSLLALFLALLLGLSLTACGGRDSAQDVTEAAIQAFQALDSESLQQYWGASLTDGDLGLAEEDAIRFLAPLTENLTYQVISAEEQEADGTAVVTVAFTNIDMGPVMSSFLSAALEDALSYASLPEEEQPTEEALSDRYTEMLIEAASQDGLATKTTTVEIPLTLVEDQWTIDPNDSVLDAMLGGLLSAAESLDEDTAS